MVKKLNLWVYIIGIISVLSLITYLYILFSEKEKDIKDKMITYQLKTIQIKEQKVQHWLKKSCHENEKIEQCLLDDPNKADNLNRLLSFIINQDIRYIFLVFQDRRGRYRFIGDGANEPAKVMQKIDPANKESWDKSYSGLKESIISSHENSDGLWLTYLSPFTVGNKSKLMLITDFSISLNEKIRTIIAPIKTILFYILSVTIIIFLIGIIQMLT